MKTRKLPGEQVEWGTIRAMRDMADYGRFDPEDNEQAAKQTAMWSEGTRKLARRVTFVEVVERS
jgi:hypothetical protein